MQARVLNPQIRIINRFYNTNLGERLDQTLIDHLSMSVVGLAAPLGNQAIGQIKLFDQNWPIQEEYLNKDYTWKCKKISDLWEDKSRMLIYYIPLFGKIDLVSAVLAEQRLKLGARLIIGTQPRINHTRKSLGRKLFKIFTSIQQFQKHASSVIVMAMAVIVIILIATFTYVSTKLNISFLDALYFAVGIITGAGGNDKVVESAPNSIK
jgi:hypothetical protein